MILNCLNCDPMKILRPRGFKVLCRNIYENISMINVYYLIIAGIYYVTMGAEPEVILFRIN